MLYGLRRLSGKDIIADIGKMSLKISPNYSYFADIGKITAIMFLFSIDILPIIWYNIYIKITRYNEL